METPLMKRVLIAALPVTLLVCLAFGNTPPAAAWDVPDMSLYPLLFQRETPLSGESATILALGDTGFGRDLTRFSDEWGMDAVLDPTKPLLQAPDLTVANYEGVIAPEGAGEKQSGPFRFRSKPEAAEALARNGFDLFSLANNHAMDYGPAGLKATIDLFAAAGVKTFGAGMKKKDAYQPLITEVRGITIAWLGYTAVVDPPHTLKDWGDKGTRAWLDPRDTSPLLKAVAAAKQHADVVIVQLHWGHEYTTCPDAWQVKTAQAAIDAGASLVIGHHPHVIQDVETYKGGFIAYSLGNFLFDQDDKPGMGLYITLDKAGIYEIRGITMSAGYLPRWHAAPTSAAYLQNSCRPLHTSSAIIGYDPEQDAYAVLPETAPPRPLACPAPSATRVMGTVDLQGDGSPERVTIRDGQLTIWNGVHALYQTDPDYHFTEAHMGDPNRDGRFEIMALMLRHDAPGAPVTTHPWVIGYRGGEFRTLWGGSATHSAVSALTLADLDGDHQEELITIERPRGALPCDQRSEIVILAWGGWNFIQQWRSAPGCYRAVTVQARTPHPVIVATGC